MGKYEPLTRFLKRQQTGDVRLSFADIERIIGSKLPPKAQHYRAWWSNNPSNNVMTKAWLDAGFRSEQVDLESRKLVFRRVSPSPPPSPPSNRKQVFGWMKGTFRIAPGVDLTQPADPDWADIVEK